MPLRPSALTINKRQNGPAGAEQLDQPVRRGLTQAELGREPRNITGRSATGVVPEKPADRIRTPAPFIPKCLVNLVGERDRSWQGSRGKRREPNSHIK